MNEQIINHLYGGVLPPGVTRRVHKARPIVRNPPGIPKPVKNNAPLILAYLEAHPWSTVDQIAEGVGLVPRSISGVLYRHSRKIKDMERRGKLRHFEYRIKG